MGREEKIEIIKELTEQYGRLYKSYSGRGMYGKSCYAIATELSPTWVEAVANSKGLFGARIDSLGTGSIVYWPSVESGPEAEETE